MDADYADEANDRRSVSGGVVKCAGACVSLTLGRKDASPFLLRRQTKIL